MKTMKTNGVDQEHELAHGSHLHTNFIRIDQANIQQAEELTRLLQTIQVVPICLRIPSKESLESSLVIFQEQNPTLSIYESNQLLHTAYIGGFSFISYATMRQRETTCSIKSCFEISESLRNCINIDHFNDWVS
jgi:hypothetical protein